jgi:peroxiredoxin-like protein
MVISNRSGTQAELSVPPEFNGPGQGTNPEELLTSAIAACYTITFGIIAENRRLPMRDVKVEAVGEVEQAGAQLRYTAITIKPRIALNADATEEHVRMAEDMAHKADGYCIITNAVRERVSIKVEPEIIRE